MQLSLAQRKSLISVKLIRVFHQSSNKRKANDFHLEGSTDGCDITEGKKAIASPIKAIIN